MVFLPKYWWSILGQGVVAAGAGLAAAFFEWLCSFDGRGVVEGTVAEHREEHVTAASG